MPQRPKQPRPSVQTPVMADPSIRITTTNENWRGKNDPAERRRIQNRLNQRAFRERQRTGETSKSASPPKQVRSDEEGDDYADDGKKGGEGGEGGDNDDNDDDDDDEEEEEKSSSDEEDDDEDDDDEAEQSNPGSPPPGPAQPHFNGQVSRAACTPATSLPSTDNPWDELAQLINRNFMQAVSANAQRLGLNSAALCAATATKTPRLRNPANLPPTLKPVEVQHQLPHDPLIDTIPHSRLRFNILRAIATGNLDAARFSASLRRSGAVIGVQGEARRSGLIVWNFPEQLSSWELSEGFVMVFGFLLEGCEDFIAATNVWRSRRGERSLVVGSKTAGR
jgi:hypothetical protein